MLDDGALEGHISVAIVVQHLVVGDLVRSLKVAIAILHIILSVGKATAELTPGEVRHERPPCDAHPWKNARAHCHHLEEPLQVIGILQIHSGPPP